MNLNKYKDLIESNPLHIATVNKDNKPNLSVASDVRVLDDNTLIISCNEMVNTQENIKTNSNVVITSFDDKWVGVRLSGTAKYVLSYFPNDFEKDYKNYKKKYFFVKIHSLETMKYLHLVQLNQKVQ